MRDYAPIGAQDRDALLRATGLSELTPEIEDLYRKYRRVAYRLGVPNLPLELITHVAVQSGCAEAPEQVSPWAHVAPGTEIYFDDRRTGNTYFGRFLEALYGEDFTLVSVSLHGDSVPSRKVPAAYIRLKPADKAKFEHLPESKPQEQTPLAVDADVLVDDKGKQREGKVVRIPGGKKSGQVFVSVLGDNAKWRVFQRSQVRVKVA